MHHPPHLEKTVKFWSKILAKRRYVHCTAHSSYATAQTGTTLFGRVRVTCLKTVVDYTMPLWGLMGTTTAQYSSQVDQLIHQNHRYSHKSLLDCTIRVQMHCALDARFNLLPTSVEVQLLNFDTRFIFQKS